jgi:hypothetical protein
VRREEHCRATVPLSTDDLAHLAGPVRVEAARRLVEYQHVRLAGQRHRQHEPLFHPLREAAGLPVDGVGDADPREQRLHVVVAPLRGDGELEVLACREPVVEVIAVG